MATRLVAGTLREIWRETVPLVGGDSQVVTTGIRVNAVSLSKVFGILRFTSIDNTAALTGTPSEVNGFLVVTIANTSASAATWILDVVVNHSYQQGNDFSGVGVIHSVSNGGTNNTAFPVLLNIAELRAFTETPVCVDVLGYYAQGDGGGGFFTWSGTSIAIDDGGMVIKPTGVVGAGRWLRMPGEVGTLNVKWFGAKGDATADDTAAIQAAINCAKAYGSSTVVLPVYPVGGYSVTGVNFPSDVQSITLMGASPQAYSQGTIHAARLIARDTQLAVVTIQATATNVTIRDLVIDCQSKATYGILFLPVEGTILDFTNIVDVGFWNVASAGAFIANFSDDPPGHGGECGNTIIDNCTFQLNPIFPIAVLGKAIYLKNSAAYFWLCKNCRFFGGGGVDGSVHVIAGDLTVLNANFDNNAHADISIEASARLTVRNVLSGSGAPFLKIAPASIPGLFGADTRVLVDRVRHFSTSGDPPEYSIIDTSNTPLTVTVFEGYKLQINPNGDKRINFQNVGVVDVAGVTHRASSMISQGDPDTSQIAQFHSRTLGQYLGINYTIATQEFDIVGYEPNVGYLPLGLGGSMVRIPFSPLELVRNYAGPIGAPAVDSVRLYLNSAAGKLQLLALFPTGAAQVVAAEP